MKNTCTRVTTYWVEPVPRAQKRPHPQKIRDLVSSAGKREMGPKCGRVG